jgi:hypothetical protein
MRFATRVVIREYFITMDLLQCISKSVRFSAYLMGSLHLVFLTGNILTIPESVYFSIHQYVLLSNPRPKSLTSLYSGRPFFLYASEYDRKRDFYPGEK